jgi:glycosyltransferase involved in cell wall biosynthesis
MEIIELTGNKTLLFIPCYNCCHQVIRVIEKLSVDIQKNFETIVFIDNCSKDKTMEQAISGIQAIERVSRFVFLKNDENYGLGGSHKVAFTFAEENSFDFVGVLHGDDQADINDLTKEIQDIKKTDIDCILGSRFLPKSTLVNYSRIRIIGNKIFNIVFSLLFRKRISDLGSGLNFYRVSALKKLNIKLFPDDLTFNYMFLTSIIFNNLNAKFVPISWREQDQVSNVKAFRQVLTLIKMAFRLLSHGRKVLDQDQRTIKRNSYTYKVIKIIDPI